MARIQQLLFEQIQFPGSLEQQKNIIILQQLEFYSRQGQHTEGTGLRGEYLALALKIFMSLRNETNSFGTLENTFHPPVRWWMKAGLDMPEPPICLQLMVNTLGSRRLAIPLKWRWRESKQVTKPQIHQGKTDKKISVGHSSIYSVQEYPC